MKHSECSPSQLKRIIACPGSRRLRKSEAKRNEAQGITRPPNPYAEEGTMLHEMTELLIEQRNPRLYSTMHTQHELDITIKHMFDELTREQKTAVEECVDYFESLIRELELITEIKQVSLEYETSLDWYKLPETSGHTDVMIRSVCPVTDIIRLDIIDWKFGQGVAVFSDNNPQAMAYAAGSFDNVNELLDAQKVVIHIVQPRLDYFSAWETSGGALLTWLEEVLRPAIFESRQPYAGCIPGEMQCKWCVGPTCVARADWIQENASEVFKTHTKMKDPKDFIELEELVPLLDKAKQVSTFIKDVSAMLFDRCMTEEGFPGWKIVSGRSSRVWRDKDDAANWLVQQAESEDYDFELDDVYETKLVSVAKAEKLAKDMKKNEDFKSLWFKTPGKPTLALESDKRDAIKSAAQAAFQGYVE